MQERFTSPEEWLGCYAERIIWGVEIYHGTCVAGNIKDIPKLEETLIGIRTLALIAQSPFFTTEYLRNNGDLRLLGEALIYFKMIEEEAGTLLNRKKYFQEFFIGNKELSPYLLSSIFNSFIEKSGYRA